MEPIKHKISRFIDCGKIINTHGCHGDVKVEPWTDTPRDLIDLGRVFLGEDEIRDGIVACKDMESGEQTNLPYEATLSRIRDGIACRNAGHVILEK